MGVRGRRRAWRRVVPVSLDGPAGDLVADILVLEEGVDAALDVRHDVGVWLARDALAEPGHRPAQDAVGLDVGAVGVLSAPLGRAPDLRIAVLFRGAGLPGLDPGRSSYSWSKWPHDEDAVGRRGDGGKCMCSIGIVRSVWWMTGSIGSVGSVGSVVSIGSVGTGGIVHRSESVGSVLAIVAFVRTSAVIAIVSRALVVHDGWWCLIDWLGHKGVDAIHVVRADVSLKGLVPIERMPVGLLELIFLRCIIKTGRRLTRWFKHGEGRQLLYVDCRLHVWQVRMVLVLVLDVGRVGLTFSMSFRRISSLVFTFEESFIAR